jgi:ABC transporter substrate binding protein (PQQ-dependent alcohol dehydrogenase system)
MMSKECNAWTAGRIIGEAATRQSAVPKKIEDFIRADDFSVAAFRGQKVTFRKWNWQLRQPVFLGDGRGVITTSPQEGFLHQVSGARHLGVDQPETKCVLK